jgi:hypothetical protein
MDIFRCLNVLKLLHRYTVSSLVKNNAEARGKLQIEDVTEQRADE